MARKDGIMELADGELKIIIVIICLCFFLTELHNFIKGKFFGFFNPHPRICSFIF